MNEVAKIERQEVAAVTPMQMLQIAVEKGTDLDQLQKLMDLQDRWESNQAKKAYVAAMTAFKADPPTIRKSKAVNIQGGASYMHATLAEVCSAVCLGLSRHGLTHRWETQQDGNRITVTCVITHEAGHSERTTMTASPDDSGRKNSIQQIASTVSYLERYTLMAATGLAAQDMDDDGRRAEVETITESQEADLSALLDDVGADRGKFLAYLNVDSLAEIPARRYRDAVRAAERKRKQ